MGLQVIEQREVLEKDFKIYGDKENPLFLAKDVANWIDHSDTSKMIKNIDEEEKLVRTLFLSGQKREALFLTEDGLYEVLMQSRKPIAKQFKKEVKKILKQIRLTGGYIPIQEEESEQDIMAKALLIAQNTLNKKDDLIKQQKEIIKAKEVELGSKNKFINQIAISQNSLLVREVGKIASKEGITIGEKTLWKKLRDWGLIFKNTTEPMQSGIDRGYFEVVEGSRENYKGIFTYKTTRVTGKGQVYIINRLMKESEVC